jgi:hypothetical protein
VGETGPTIDSIEVAESPSDGNPGFLVRSTNAQGVVATPDLGSLREIELS